VVPQSALTIESVSKGSVSSSLTKRPAIQHPKHANSLIGIVCSVLVRNLLAEYLFAIRDVTVLNQREVKMQKYANLIVSGLLVACLISVVDATPLFGVYGRASAGVQLAPGTNLAQSSSEFYQLPGIQQQTTAGLSIPDISLQVGPAVIGNPPFVVVLRGETHVSGLINDGMLHGSVTALAPEVIYGTGPTTAGSSAVADLVELWQDTLYLSAPAGSRVQFAVTTHFAGSVSGVGVSADIATSTRDALSDFQLSTANGLSCSDVIPKISSDAV
jgi:hypothetical protein